MNYSKSVETSVLGQHHFPSPPEEPLMHRELFLATIARNLLAKDPEKRMELEEVMRLLRERLQDSPYKHWVGPAMVNDR